MHDLQDWLIKINYPFSARLAAIKAPKPEAPPVTIADLSFKIERSKVFDMSATGVILSYWHLTKEGVEDDW